MATVIVFSMPLLGHVNPTLPLVQELVRRGERVIYYSDPSMRSQITATGAEFRPVPWDPATIFARQAAPLVQMLLSMTRCCESWLPSLLAKVRAERPAYLMVDFMCIWGRFVGQNLGLPIVILSPSFAMHPSMTPPGLLVTARDVGPSLTRLRTLAEFRALADRLARTYRVERLRLPTDIYSMDGDLILVFTSRLFQPQAERFDERFKFIGSCIDDRAGERADALPELDERPLVYISLGTLFNYQPDFLRDCIEAFRDNTYQVVMAIGNHVDARQLGSVPGHIHVRAYVHQLAVLRRTTVFICHGGMNSTSEALMNNVPLIVFPQAADQFQVAQRIEELGVGVKLRRQQRRPRALRELVDRVSQDAGMRARCRRVRDSYVQAGGAVRGADELFAFRDRYASYMRSA